VSRHLGRRSAHDRAQYARPLEQPRAIRFLPVTRKATTPNGIPLLGAEPEHGILYESPAVSTFFPLDQAQQIADGMADACAEVRKQAFGKLVARVAFEVVVPDWWEVECVKGSTYWARIERTEDNRWKLTEHDDEEGVHHLDTADAYVRACRRWGELWTDGRHNDADGYDIAVQLSIFGEVRYG
jgi:hypothetical protein